MSVTNVRRKLRTLLLFSVIQFVLLVFLGYVFSLVFGLPGIGYAWLVCSVATTALIIIIEKKNIRQLLATITKMRVADIF